MKSEISAFNKIFTQNMKKNMQKAEVYFFTHKLKFQILEVIVDVHPDLGKRQERLIELNKKKYEK